MSLKLLAIGDVHFDSPSLLDEDERKELEKLKKEAFKKATDEAIARNVSAFMICGDLYEEQCVSFETLIFLRKCFLQLNSCGIKIIYAHGKADPSAAPDILRTSNFVDFSHEIERFELNSSEGVPEAIIYSSGYSSSVAFLAEQLEQKGINYPTIGMIYDNEGFSNQSSFILESLADLNYDLFILGGYHHYVVARADSNLIYAGSPTGTWFGDKSGGALYAEINSYGQMMLDKIPLSDAAWYDIEISNITECDMGSLTRRIEADIQSTVEHEKDAFVRVVLTGRCPLAEEITEEAAAEMAHDLKETLGVNILVQKQNLLPMLPKSLFESTSPFVESVKIIDSIKNDDDKFEAALETAGKQYELFYSTLAQEQKKDFKKQFKKGLLDTICKVMIKEADYEN